ncbi:MAG TPA: dTDP-4-dehydrorhamnose 3,5-epimerase [Actinobacteria bacterium]|nr:dTDP-4-dehydrorhamnose 3,5-epimerase [Actinomycetota bacterium]
MIKDVQIKKLKTIPDERGFLMEMLRCDDSIFEKFGQVYITGCKKGAAKAWHYHKEQDDHFICVSGKTLVVLCDLRKDSSTYKEVNEFVLEAPPAPGGRPHCEENEPTACIGGQILLKIPAWVAHGFAALDCDEARIINVPTKPYRYDNPDELRFPWDSEEIPYKWPDFITYGG